MEPEDCEEGVKLEDLKEETSDEKHDPSVYERSLLPQYLKVYYKWLFPYDKYFEWLEYGELKGVVDKFIIVHTSHPSIWCTQEINRNSVVESFHSH